MRVSVFSFAVNDKFPIDVQHRQFQKYIKDPNWDFTLLNDAMDSITEQNLNTIAKHNKIKSVRIPQSIHTVQNPSSGYAASLNWAVQQYAVQNDCEIVLLIHSDVFPIQDVVVENIIGTNKAASCAEAKVVNGKTLVYMYPALTIINIRAVKDQIGLLDFGPDVGLDCGGLTYRFVEKNTTSVRLIHNHQIRNVLNSLPLTMQQYLTEDLTICANYGLNAGWIAEGFYHYMAGSQWNAENDRLIQGHRERMELFLRYLY